MAPRRQFELAPRRAECAAVRVLGYWAASTLVPSGSGSIRGADPERRGSVKVDGVRIHRGDSLNAIATLFFSSRPVRTREGFGSSPVSLDSTIRPPLSACAYTLSSSATPPGRKNTSKGKGSVSGALEEGFHLAGVAFDVVPEDLVDLCEERGVEGDSGCSDVVL
jgi:hypothetical protein